ncbi:QWRF motif-containing protein 4-like isoform X2 [Phragmites australis]|uniref:QWRF motif-containing protein 4-like isoform X2 n=1 Tax=Phragmites australis TaxID=29695 RepID=UPI002D76F043|nr:QWRF motif-containing protein 4-like isoform X2 [Phragmites australis]
MDAVKVEVRKAAAATADGAPRRPLVPSEKSNAAPAGRRREVVSRFKPVVPLAPAPAGIAARRCTSPCPGRASAIDGTAPCNRAWSADRASPAAPSAAPSSRLKPSTAAAARSCSPARDAAAEVNCTPPRATSAKAPDGLWASARSRSPSLRSESVPAPAKKMDRLVRGLPSEMAKVKVQANAAAERKRSPLRGNTNSIGDQSENARSSESPSKRVIEQHRWPAMMSGRGSAGLTSTTAAPAGKAGRTVSSSNPSAGRSPRRMSPSEGTNKCLNGPPNEMAQRAAVHRSRRGDKADSSSDTSSQTSVSSKAACRPSRAISSPVPFLHRSSSPSKVLSAASSTSKTYQSPQRIRPSASCRSKCASAAQSGVAQPVFNYIADARKGKKNASQIENIHHLRLLNNRYLQWRFVNAHSEETPSSRKISVESILYSVWISILTLRDALTITRIDVLLLQQEMKLYYILTEQITYLEQWPVLEEENGSTLVEAIKALKASTLRLPVTSGAQADALAVKNAISSAVDVMQVLSSSICYFQSKVEDRTSLVSQLSVMARQEKAALDECRELLASAAKLQEASIRTLLMQLGEGIAG